MSFKLTIRRQLARDWRDWQSLIRRETAGRNDVDMLAIYYAQLARTERHMDRLDMVRPQQMAMFSEVESSPLLRQDISVGLMP